MRLAYVALDERGLEVAGDLDAPDAAEAARTLRGRGLFPVELRPGAAARGAAGAASDGGAPATGLALPTFVKASDLVLFLSQLALMLRAGLTLLRALETLAQESPKAPLRACARRLGEAVQAGRPLSTALLAEGRYFPPLVAQLVRTAEATGELDQAFTRAADFLERRAALRVQLMTSLAYPTIVLLSAAGVFWFLTTRVVPKFAAFLAQRNAALPWTTQRLMDVSSFLVAWGGWVLLGLALAGLGLLAAWRTARGRLALERVALAVPVLGGLLQASALAATTRTFALLLRSGLPLLEALPALAGSSTLGVYAQALGRARERVVQGASVAQSLTDPLVPPLVTRVVAVGEQTGALDEVLGELAEHYDRRVQQLVRLLASLVEPALLVVIGGMVGFVYISFFQALFSLSAR